MVESLMLPFRIERLDSKLVIKQYSKLQNFEEQHINHYDNSTITFDLHIAVGSCPNSLGTEKKMLLAAVWGK